MYVVVLTLLQTGNVFFSKVVTDSIPNAVKSTIRATNFVLYVWRGFFLPYIFQRCVLQDLLVLSTCFAITNRSNFTTILLLGMTIIISGCCLLVCVLLL